MAIRGLAPPAKPARVVKPRKPAQAKLPILVCDSDFNAWYEGKKHKWELYELIQYLRRNWPGSTRKPTPIMFVCENPHRILYRLAKIYDSDPEWNFQVKVSASERFWTDGTYREPKIRSTNDFTIGFFGFRDDNGHTHYFHPISPHDFTDEFREYHSDIPDYIRLYAWSGELRSWIRQNKLRFNARRGGLAAQLLRDKRFYSDARRKVPKETNEKARTALPGNFYAARNVRRTDIHPRVFIIDQENAHHYAAENVTLPNANSLFARGRFATTRDLPFVRHGKPLYNQLINEHGLLRVCAQIPRYLDTYVPPWGETTSGGGSLSHFYIFTNELQLCRELEIDIRYISYAWTSPEIDTGLAKYAKWSQSQITPKNKHWLKPLLLSAYGVLGARPRRIEMGYLRSKKGEPKTYQFGATPMRLQHISTKKEIQAPIANIIQRGMIEAETRTLSIQLAHKLSKEGHKVLGIHADGIMVRDEGQQLPLLPPPWRLKETLYQFQMLDPVSFTSEHRNVLPGRRRDKRIAQTA